jgi:N6-L-threonylcarbamoyladenine synthase
MKILALDTSCDESCAAVVDVERGKLLSDVVHTHVPLMQQYGGIVPELASREHLKALPLAVHEAMTQAALSPRELDWITVTNRPGLVGALLVGVSFAKALAFSLERPFSAMNHIEAHLFSPCLTEFQGESAPAFPWIALVVSGGHTELFLVRNYLDYEWLGGTLDDAAGEAFDKVGKLLSLPYPAGPKLDQWVRAQATEADRALFRFPRAQTPDFHFSFSGLKTAVALQIKKLEPLSDKIRLAIAASAQEAILDSLIQKIRTAQKVHAVDQVVITGGVACNSRLRERLPDVYFPSPRHCADNAAMVACLSAIYAREKKLKPDAWETTASASIVL